jgi:hypothetical protein
MAVIKKPQKPESSHYRSLVGKLAKELQRNEPTGPATAPQIIEEEQRGNFLHVTVIWDAWKGVVGEDRGRIIMDAYEQQRPADVTRITIALGLTHAEADRLGVHA